MAFDGVEMALGRQVIGAMRNKAGDLVSGLILYIFVG